MSESISTETPNTEASAPAGTDDALRSTLAALQADNAALSQAATQAKAQLADALRERDILKAVADKFEPLSKEADGLRVQVQGFVNSNRESAIVEMLRSKLPSDKTPFEIRSAVLGFHEAGKANRHAEDAAAESAKLLKLIESEAPSLTRPATSGGGTPSARGMSAGPQRNSLVG